MDHIIKNTELHSFGSLGTTDSRIFKDAVMYSSDVELCFSKLIPFSDRMSIHARLTTLFTSVKMMPLFNNRHKEVWG